jgi:hypothetical protein
LLTPNTFACLQQGGVTTGARLGRFLHGRYSVTVIGLDPSGAEVGRATTAFEVHAGNNVVAVDVPIPPQGSASLLWTFAGKSCAAAGVTAVQLDVDGLLVTDANGSFNHPCTQAGVEGVQVAGLAPGQHLFDVVGLSGSTPAYFLQDIAAVVVDKQDTAVPVNLTQGPVPAPIADVFWGFAGGALGAMTCAEAKVDTVRLYLDPAPNGSGGTLVAEYPCTNSGVDGIAVSGMPSGIHYFAAVGLRASQIQYASRHRWSAQLLPGLHAAVDVDAQATGSGRGDATLFWDFSPAPACQGSIHWTVTDPVGNVSVSMTTPCSQPSYPLPNALSGLWRFDGDATVNGSPVSSHVFFGVPNQASANWTIQFSK